MGMEGPELVVWIFGQCFAIYQGGVDLQLPSGKLT